MNKDEFIKETNLLGINLTDEELAKFEEYKELLKEYNKKFNLTSITNDNEIYLKHFYDSLCIMKAQELLNSSSLLDIGTGAGFPGIPVAIVNKDIKITLVESNKKKCEFLKVVKVSLNLQNVEIINARAEDFAKTNREKFEVATSRAVANLSILLELEFPALSVGGVLIALKSNVQEELENSKSILKELNGTIKNTIEYTLPYEESKRTLLIIQKQLPTNSKYPRQYSQIIKSQKSMKKL